MRRFGRHLALALIAALAAPATHALAQKQGGKKPLGASYVKKPLGSQAAGNVGKPLEEKGFTGSRSSTLGKSRDGNGGGKGDVKKPIFPKKKTAFVATSGSSKPAVEVEAEGKPSEEPPTISERGGKITSGKATANPEREIVPVVDAPVAKPARIAPQRRKATAKRVEAEQQDGLAVELEDKASRLRQIASTATQTARRLTTEAEDAGIRLGNLRNRIRGMQQRRGAIEVELVTAEEFLKQAMIDTNQRMKQIFDLTGATLLDVFSGGLPKIAADLIEAEQIYGALAMEKAQLDVSLAQAGVQLDGLVTEALAKGGQATEAQNRAAQSRKDADDAEGKAQGQRRVAGKAKQEADDAEAKAVEAEFKYAQGRGNLDQHAVRVAQLPSGKRAKYLQALRKFKVVTAIESKPGEISQDAVAAAPELGLFAIADGVTNSDFSGEFARALVRHWTSKPAADAADFGKFLKKVQAEWEAETAPQIQGRATNWYNRNKVWKADAAFVGAQLVRSGKKQQLKVLGIGDTVAILVRDGEIKKSFPLGKAADFSDQVQALPSKGEPSYKVREASWDVKPGDEVYMATDALAAWILGEVEAGREPFKIIGPIKKAATLAEFTAFARAGKVKGRVPMNVDDTTLMHFVIPSSSDGE
jgi:hypothetical protein